MRICTYFKLYILFVLNFYELREQIFYSFPPVALLYSCCYSFFGFILVAVVVVFRYFIRELYFSGLFVCLAFTLKHIRKGHDCRLVREYVGSYLAIFCVFLCISFSY